MRVSAIDALLEQLHAERSAVRVHLEVLDQAIGQADALRETLAANDFALPAESVNDDPPAPPRKMKTGGTRRGERAHTDREDGIYFDSPELLDEIVAAIRAVDPDPASRADIVERMTIEVSTTGDGRGRRYTLPLKQSEAEQIQHGNGPVEPEPPADPWEDATKAAKARERREGVAYVWCEICKERSIATGADKCAWCDGPLVDAKEVAQT
jgi:hypothetical protein